MRRALTILGIACAAAGTAVAASAGGSGSPRLTALASVRFPDRAFVLTTKKPLALSAANVRVHENGERVSGFSVVPATRTARGTFGVVLVIDTSNSMRGAAIAGAMKAARIFAAHTASRVSLGVVTFNRTVRVVVPPTTREKRVRAALSSLPALAAGTHIYDGAARAIDVLKAAKIKAGTIVLLTDGRDTGSSLSPKLFVAKARSSGVRVFAVGLHSPQFSPAPLRSLARATGAAYSEATSAVGLSAIYRTRSEQLAREYLLRYRSLAGPATTVHVQVAAEGVPSVGTWSYTTPALPTTALAPYHRSFVKRFVKSSGSVIVMSLLTALLAWFAVSTVLRQRQSTLRQRVGAFVGVERADPALKRQVTSPGEWFLESVVPSAERLFQRSPSWERFEEELEIAKFPVAPVPLVAMTAVGTIFAAIVFGLISPVLALLGLGVPFVVRSIYKQRLRRQREAFAEQLPDNLTVLAASLRAGHSFVGALSAVVDEAEEPSSSELRRAVADEQLGVPVEDALLRVAERMASADLEQVALVASLQRETGGNTAEVLDTVVDAIRERFELRRLVRSLTAQGRLSRWILTGLPLAVLLLVSLVNPSYLRPLFVTSGGQIMLAVTICLLILGSYFVKRITEIEI